MEKKRKKEGEDNTNGQPKHKRKRLDAVSEHSNALPHKESTQKHPYVKPASQSYPRNEEDAHSSTPLHQVHESNAASNELNCREETSILTTTHKQGNNQEDAYSWNITNVHNYQEENYQDEGVEQYVDEVLKSRDYKEYNLLPQEINNDLNKTYCEQNAATSLQGHELLHLSNGHIDEESNIFPHYQQELDIFRDCQSNTNNPGDLQFNDHFELENIIRDPSHYSEEDNANIHLESSTPQPFQVTKPCLQMEPPSELNVSQVLNTLQQLHENRHEQLRIIDKEGHITHGPPTLHTLEKDPISTDTLLTMQPHQNRTLP